MGHSHHDHGADHSGHSHAGHDHAGHNHAPANFDRAFTVGITLNLAFVALEVAFGLAAHSIALVADAGHNFSDVLGLVLAWWASSLGKRPPTKQRTYGFKRASILAALANAFFLLITLGAIAWEAILRLRTPEPVAGTTMIWVAAIGILVNSVTAWMFMSGRKHDINIRGAFLHMVADAGITLGVVIAGFVILKTGWLWLDPVVSLAIVGVIVVGTMQLARDGINMALDSVPNGIDLAEIKAYLSRLEGVTEVHDLHVWNMSTTEHALTVHLVRPGMQIDDGFLSELCEHLHEEFDIDHPTIQIEAGDPDVPCRLAPEHVV